MSIVLDRLGDFLTAHNCEFEKCEGERLRGVGGGDLCRWTWTAGTDGDLVHWYAFVAFNVPASKRLAVSEYFARVNYSLKLGSFEMDWNDGEVRLHTSLILDGEQVPADRQLEHLIFGSGWLMERYVPGLLKVS